MIPTFRVSHLAAYARWKQDEEAGIDWLLNSILDSKPTPAMAKGTAFHHYLEHAQDGTVTDDFTVDGFRFVITADITVSLPRTRETRQGKDYGGIIVSGQADCIEHRTIYDHKTTERFDAENYLDGWQHKFYMDIFDADRFVWNVWEMKKIDEKGGDPEEYGHNAHGGPIDTYEVYGFHQLTQYRYPELEADCRSLALEFKSFADKWVLPKMGAPRPPEFPMHATKGHNLVGVGWGNGVLRCAFAGKEGKRFYRYSNVPEAEFVKLRNSPFPDRLFTSNIKGKFTCTAEQAPSQREI
jgi:hypothetical protein